MVLELIFVSFFSFCCLFLMRKVAKSVGLVDKPNARKLHVGAIPLVGGISIFLSIGEFLTTSPNTIEHSYLFLGCTASLIVLGAADDRFDISFKLRLFMQAAVSILMITFADIQLENIGNILGFGEMSFGVLSPIFTVLAVIGAINAFNMVDGIDGLLGGLAIVTFGALAYLLKIDSQHGLAYLCAVFIAATIPYILMNLGLFGRERRVFMGDAGSMMIGFTVIWMLLGASQPTTDILIRPVTALWLIAIPLMDMAAIMYRRVRRGNSPFKPDREHLHHIFQRIGFSSRQTLLIICTIASLFAAFGIYGETVEIRESIMFGLFIVCFLAYSVALSYVWRITTWLRRWRGLPEKVFD
ncbi:UDP-N-acetylglucosamine--undecaprenyl-phosphate N-acetylglucosaminephosphotransferase [Vibrio sp. SM6]|uniref:Undecaprenyl-phosphate alpha-N-acetylglucosaminyl 1-phosphate transferase n=1 Tax=Vibrio agarilyticus TaxID=2726741 RepID=A0A7X8TRY9_9VIBR|nr:UDP-N-acetylglucosamine--undecaprenyl-phosphate N-acetylglucosaminephosphotransferase [Vibrio agarilyticus]NLS13517.1 UDP-N-acetylglucosamine--undecaprenyl-phosphate N-acetylglucosaminephosphotransferase [Vibrio agarilyticus]